MKRMNIKTNNKSSKVFFCENSNFLNVDLKVIKIKRRIIESTDNKEAIIRNLRFCSFSKLALEFCENNIKKTKKGIFLIDILNYP